MDDFIRSLSNLGYNESNTSLCADLPPQQERDSCKLHNEEEGILDGVAGVRMITSLLGLAQIAMTHFIVILVPIYLSLNSLMGACSIIISAVLKRRVFSSEVHPIFMLSLADCLLSVLFIAGSSLWLSDTSYDTYNRIWCYPITLSTGILECVAINLTLVYAILAYIRTRRTEVHTFLVTTPRRTNDVSKKFVVIIYLISWFLPVFIILSMFVIMDSFFNFIEHTQECSCWCRPTVVNVLPFAKFVDKASIDFMHKQLSFTLSFSVVISVQYIVVFILLVTLYLKVLFRIRALRKEFESRRNISNYGATVLIVRGQSQARKRVVLFLTVFVAGGFFNLCSEVFLLPFLGNMVYSKKHFSPLMFSIYSSLLFAQSITLPLQGFLNALVYGWTRDDFINVMTLPLDQDQVDEPGVATDPEGFERSFSNTLESDNSMQENLLSQDAIQ